LVKPGKFLLLYDGQRGETLRTQGDTEMGNVPPREKQLDVRASWSSGLLVRTGDLAKTLYVGIFVDAGISDALDACAEQAGWVRGGINHGGTLREHWLMPDGVCDMHILIDSLPVFKDGSPLDKMLDYMKYGVTDYGIGARWPKVPQGGLQSKPRSALGVMVLFADLIRQGYVEPVSFVVTSSNTDDLIKIFIRHNEVAQYANHLAAEKGSNIRLEFCDVALRLVPGPEVTRGTGELTSVVYSIGCGHPADLTPEYLRQLLAPKGMVVNEWYAYHVADGARILEWADRFATPLTREGQYA
jgi:hypothetical protein